MCRGLASRKIAGFLGSWRCAFKASRVQNARRDSYRHRYTTCVVLSISRAQHLSLVALSMQWHTQSVPASLGTRASKQERRRRVNQYRNTARSPRQRHCLHLASLGASGPFGPPRPRSSALGRWCSWRLCRQRPHEGKSVFELSRLAECLAQTSASVCSACAVLGCVVHAIVLFGS